MKRELTAIAFAGLMSASTAWAGEVGPVTTFSSGSAALASEVNGNFSALITAINDNAGRLDALEAAADNNVGGHTYSLFYAGTFFAAEVDTDDAVRDYSSVEHYAGQGSLTFDEAGGGGNGSAQDIAGAEFVHTSSGTIFWDGDGADETAETLIFTWQQTDQQLTVWLENELGEVEEELNFVLSEDGSLAVGQGTDSGIDDRETSNADFSDISTVILIRN